MSPTNPAPEWFASLLGFLPEPIVIAVWFAIVAVCLLVPVIIYMAYVTLAERRVLGYMHARIGANRVGPQGMFQPFADLFKMMGKEIIIPSSSNKILFLLAPMLSLIPALMAWAVIPIGPFFGLWSGDAVANINAGVLYLLALSSAGVYGVILAGWATNSKYAFLGAMRAAAQMVAYEIAMGFAVVGVIMASGSLNLGEIIEGQRGGLFSFYWFWLLPLAVVFFTSGLAETNRTPFDVVEGESEIVAGPHVEYSGMAFALFYVAEYINMILISAMTSVFFFGGWLSPFEGIPLPGFLSWLAADSMIWFIAKFSFFLFCFLWFRATFPRYRYDQIMRLGWKIFIPVTLVWIAVECVLMVYKIGPWSGG